MGSTPYWYTVPYEADINAALQKLRMREFKAGRYNPVMPFPDFPVTAASPAPGAQHRSIEEALEASDADGTRSILDVTMISDEPEFGSACRLSDVVAERIFGTTEPTVIACEENMDFLEDIERGQAVYLILFEKGEPDKILFAGYSFD